MSAKKLTDLDFQNFQQELEAQNLMEQKGELSVHDCLRETEELRKLMVDTLDRTVEPSALRVTTWRMINKRIQVLRDLNFQEERAAGVKFPANALLDLEARGRISDVSKMINNMIDTPDSEKSVRDAIASLNNYGKYIHAQHPELQKLRQKYMDKTASNYMEYAKSNRRTALRDGELKKKVKGNFDNHKYSNSTQIQALLTLLEPRLPEAE